MLHVVDISHPKYEEQMNTVNKTLQEIGAIDKPVITVFNKIDEYERLAFDEWLESETRQEIVRQLEERWQKATENRSVFISAIERKNIDKLRACILENVRVLYKARYPYKTDYLF